LPYDPWTDIDDSGTIDMKDIGNTAARFMATGDPTKNVKVTNWPVENMATDCLTVELIISVEDDYGQNGGIYSNTSENSLGGRNITMIGGDVNGGITWGCFGAASSPDMTSGSFQAIGTAKLFDSGGNLLVAFTLPMNHKISVSNVYKITLKIEAAAPRLWFVDRNFQGVGSATIYWVES